MEVRREEGADGLLEALDTTFDGKLSLASPNSFMVELHPHFA